MANKIIYVVTSGDYSGYQIEALFSTQKKAEEYIEHTYDPDYYRIEEYVLDGERPNREEKLFHVSIGYEDFNAKISDRYEKNCFRAEELRDTFHLSDSGEYVEMYFVTTGPKRALKIASEWLAQIKAEEYINHSTDSDLNGVDEWVLNELKPDKREKLFEIRSDFENIDCEIVGNSSEPMMYKDLMHIMNFGLGGRIQYIYFYICADTRGRAIKIASERLRQVKAEEHFRFPMLRRLVGFRYYDSKVVEFPYIHYHTGEIVLPEGYTLGTITVPKDLEPHVKVITMEELVERYKKEE